MTARVYPPGPKDWLGVRLYRDFAGDTLGLLERAKDLKGWLESRAVPRESEDSRNRIGKQESCL